MVPAMLKYTKKPTRQLIAQSPVLTTLRSALCLTRLSQVSTTINFSLCKSIAKQGGPDRRSTDYDTRSGPIRLRYDFSNICSFSPCQHSMGHCQASGPGPAFLFEAIPTYLTEIHDMKMNVRETEWAVFEALML